jgi:hypothetical protein
MLPLPKAEKKTAVKHARLRTESAEWRNWLEVGYLTLSNFQDGVGRTPCQHPVFPPNKDLEFLRNWLRSDAGKASMAAFEIWKRWNDLAIKDGDFLLSKFSSSGDPDFEYAMIDGTIVRVHQHGAGAKGGLKIRQSDDRAVA